MRPRIALATYEAAPELAPDDRLLLPALAAAGIDAEPAVRSDDAVIWEAFDGVVIRSCWDYHLHIQEFKSWLARLDAGRLPVWNPISLVEWNSDKRYLLDLARRGVATIPTMIVPPGASADVEAIAEAEGWSRFVLKPAVSASGHETHALRLPLDAVARETIARAASGSDLLVQPFAAEVPKKGEFSFTFIDGALSHATIKRAAEGEFRVQTEHGGSVTPITIPRTLAAQAEHVLRALPEPPLYARVDGIERGGAFLLMELELIEPNLFFEFGAGSAERFAAALARRIQS
jgi:glutathione synthase/RimK-type ligase-like ATP-grasp enzyme